MRFHIYRLEDFITLFLYIMDKKILAILLFGGFSLNTAFAQTEDDVTLDNLNVTGDVAVGRGLSVGVDKYFKVLSSGELYAPSIRLKNKEPNLYINYLGENIGWNFSTSYFSSTGVFNSPVTFDASKFLFSNGDVAVDNNLNVNGIAVVGKKLEIGSSFMDPNQIQIFGYVVSRSTKNSFLRLSLGFEDVDGSSNGEENALLTTEYSVPGGASNSFLPLSLAADNFRFKKGDVTMDNNLNVNGSSVFSGPVSIKNSLSLKNSADERMVCLDGESGYISGAYLDLRPSRSVNYHGSYFRIISDAVEEGNVWSLGSYINDAPTSLNINTMKLSVSGELNVEGTITCKEQLKVVQVETDQLKAKNVTVDMNNAADYVFEDDYQLQSLKEVESYVKENKHLPGIPSASQMKEEGVNLSDMCNMLLEKVEELTLHLIRVEKENELLKAKFEARGE